MKKILTYQQLKKILSYDEESGNLTWLVSRGTKKSGSYAGSINSYGYVVVGINGCIYIAHQIAWTLAKGSPPHSFIDHINGNKSDNRIKNLRIVSKSQNSENQRKAHSDNKTGFIGVTYLKNIGKYQAQICHKGGVKYLGVFEQAEDAHAAYIHQKRIIHSACTI